MGLHSDVLSLAHNSNSRQTLRTKMRPKDMICQNLLLGLNFCCLSDFHCSPTRFAVHLLPYVVTRFCKYEQKRKHGLDFIRKLFGSVLFKTACTQDFTVTKK